MAGYDLLNEPLLNEYQYQYQYGDELVTLYRELTDTIRAVDPNHLIIYEGMHWATNWEIFTEVWDPQSVPQFHRYWSPPDRPGIQRFLDVRERLKLPIYMGEGGREQSRLAADRVPTVRGRRDLVELLALEEIETLTSPCSVVAPDGWAEV